MLANQRRAAGRRAADGPLVPLEAVADPTRGRPVADLVADREAFATAFAALSPGDREVLALVSWDGLAPGEAATVLGFTPATFYLRLHRARRRLLKELEACGHPFGERAAGPVTRPRADATEARPNKDNDDIKRGLGRLDPVAPGELDGAGGATRRRR